MSWKRVWITYGNVQEFGIYLATVLISRKSTLSFKVSPQTFVFFDLPERALIKNEAHVQEPTSNKPSTGSIATEKEPIQFATLFAVLVMSCIHGIPSLPGSFVIEHHFSLCHYCDVALLVEVLLLSVEVDLNFGRTVVQLEIRQASRDVAVFRRTNPVKC